MAASDRSQLYDSGSRSIPGYGPLLRLESSDVFAPARPAMVVAAQAGEGKTVAAVDMVYTNLSSITGFTYVTNSYDSPANGYLRTMIPELHVKNWDVNLLCSIWGDILQRSLALGQSMDDKMLDRFLQGRCPNDKMLFSELESIDRLVQTNADLFPDVPCGKEAIAAHKKMAKINFIKTHFRLDDPSLSIQERDVVRATRSSKPLYCLIADDVTAQIRSPLSDDLEIPTISESNQLVKRQMKGKDGLNFLLINILTLARHFAIIGFFVHTFDAFDATVRSQFGGMMFMGADSIEQACRERVLSPGDKDLIRGAWDIAKDYPHHKVVLYTNPDMTNHKQRVAILKPTYHTQPKPIGVPTFQAVMRNISMAIEQFQGGEVHRARVKSIEQQRAAEAEALAKEGASSSSAVPVIQIPLLQQGTTPSVFAAPPTAPKPSLGDLLDVK